MAVPSCKSHTLLPLWVTCGLQPFIERGHGWEVGGSFCFFFLCEITHGHVSVHTLPLQLKAGCCTSYHSVGSTPARPQIKYQHEKDHGGCVCIPPTMNLETANLRPRSSRTEPHVFQVETSTWSVVITVLCAVKTKLSASAAARNIYSWDFLSFHEGSKTTKWMGALPSSHLVRARFTILLVYTKGWFPFCFFLDMTFYFFSSYLLLKVACCQQSEEVKV